MQLLQTGFNFTSKVLGASLFATFLAMSAGCPGYTMTDAGPGDGDGDGDAPPDCMEQDPCKRNIDCEAGAICEKPEGAGVDDWGCCLKILCTADADCDDNEVCDQRRGLCVPEDLCDPGNPGEKCQPGEFCIYQDGLPQCVDAASLPQPDACSVTPAKVYLADGASQTVNATGSLSSGALVPNAVFTYSTTGDIGTIAGGSNVLTAACAGPDACTGTITASSGGASCEASVTVYPAIADGFRVTVFDSLNSEPIQGATVALQIDGAQALVTGTTGAAGDAVFAAGDITGTVLAASVFPTTHHWQTVLNPGSIDVSFYTVEIPSENETAGVKGTFDFDQLSTQGDIKLGLAGLSIRSSLVDTDFALLLGEIADYEIELEGVTNGPELVPLPGGLVIELGTTEIKPDFVAQGDPGQRILWALGGKVRLADIGPIISSVTASDDINFGSILSAVLPFFAKFDHAVVTGDKLNLTPQTRPTQNGDNPIPYADWPFEELSGADAVALNTLLSQNTTYDVPTLPCAPGKVNGAGCTDDDYASGAILLTGVVVPGQGIVPLGLTAGLDDPDEQDTNDQFDGVLDYIGENTPNRGQAILDYAPPHDGLEGNPYITIAVALDIETLAGGGGIQASTIVNVTDSFAAGTNNFPKSFLEQPGGTFNKTAGTVAVEGVDGADFYRLNVSTGTAEWNIYSATAPASVDFGALKPASVTENRTDHVDVGAFVLGNGFLTGGDQPTFDDLIGFNGTNFDENFVYYMGGWASTECLPADGEDTPHCLEQ